MGGGKMKKWIRRDYKERNSGVYWIPHENA
jgi:hypothetical protein